MQVRLPAHPLGPGLALTRNQPTAAGDMREVLRHIYADVFVEHLVKNPLWVAEEPITCATFVRDIDAYLGGLQQK